MTSRANYGHKWPRAFGHRHQSQLIRQNGRVAQLEMMCLEPSSHHPTNGDGMSVNSVGRLMRITNRATATILVTIANYDYGENSTTGRNEVFC